MSHEDLKTADYLGQRNGSVFHPVAYSLSIIDHNDKILLFALIMDLRLGSVSARHVDQIESW